MTTIQDLSQRDRALQKANRVRVATAALLAEIADLPTREGARTVAQLIERADPRVGHLTPARLLVAPHRYGPNRMRAIVKSAGVPSDKPLRQMTDRQRDVLSLAVLASLAEPTR